jgi:hypothetical protein
MGRRVWVPVVSGPLAPFAAGFESWLRSRTYSPSAAADRLYQFDQLSRWLEREGLGAGELTGEQAERFVAARRAGGLVTWVSPQSVALPLGYLRALGVASAPTAVGAQGPLEELLEDYRRYMSIERGLSDHTVFDAYEPAARLFLAGCEGRDRLGLWPWHSIRHADGTCQRYPAHPTRAANHTVSPAIGGLRRRCSTVDVPLAQRAEPGRT